jgi:hypothetical protein
MTKKIFVIIAALVAITVIFFILLKAGEQNVVNDEVITDPANAFTFKKPTGWEIDEFNCGSLCKTDDSVQNFDYYEVTLKPNDENVKTEIRIQLEREPLYKNFTEMWDERTIDQFNTYERLDINDYEAFYNKIDFTGPSDVEKYVDHYYVLNHEGKIATFYFREKYSHQWEKDRDVDAAKYLSDFNFIVNSISFK